ncbi:MAG: hypothetical protein HZB54_09475 [Deltaproteobacteria bacterium]|nr:hypothetical protein [Deltaproteobacteria bacterium]
MKILIVTPFLPYLCATHAGGISVFESIKAISKDHEVYLFSRIEPFEINYVADLKPFCKEVHFYIFETPASRNPVSIIFSYMILGMKAHRLMKENAFGLVQAEFTETGFAMRSPSIPSVFVAYDVISKPAKRRLYVSKTLRKKIFNALRFKVTRLVELFISRKFAKVLAMPDGYRKVLLYLNRAIDAEVSPNLLHPDFDVYVGYAGGEAETLLFAGAMHRDVNVEAVPA